MKWVTGTDGNTHISEQASPSSPPRAVLKMHACHSFSHVHLTVSSSKTVCNLWIWFDEDSLSFKRGLIFTQMQHQLCTTAPNYTPQPRGARAGNCIWTRSCSFHSGHSLWLVYEPEIEAKLRVGSTDPTGEQVVYWWSRPLQIQKSPLHSAVEITVSTKGKILYELCLYVVAMQSFIHSFRWGKKLQFFFFFQI